MIVIWIVVDNDRDDDRDEDGGTNDKDRDDDRDEDGWRGALSVERPSSAMIGWGAGTLELARG